MTDLRARVAYLQGLAEGMELDDSTREGRLLGEMIDVLDAVAGSVDKLEEDQRQLEQYVCEVDQDLSDVEDEVLLGGRTRGPTPWDEGEVDDEFELDGGYELDGRAGETEADDEEDPDEAVRAADGQGDPGRLVDSPGEQFSGADRP